MYARIILALRAAFTKSPELAKTLATKLGNPGLTASQLFRQVKENPTTAALALLEIGEVGAPLLDELLARNPQLRALMGLGQAVDDANTTFGGPQDIVKFHDEFAVIDQAARSVGGMTKLLVLKRALEMPVEVYKLREQVRGM